MYVCYVVGVDCRSINFLYFGTLYLFASVTSTSINPKHVWNRIKILATLYHYLYNFLIFIREASNKINRTEYLFGMHQNCAFFLSCHCFVKSKKGTIPSENLNFKLIKNTKRICRQFKINWCIHKQIFGSSYFVSALESLRFRTISCQNIAVA